MTEQKAANLRVEDGVIKVSDTKVKDQLTKLSNAIRVTSAARKRLIEAMFKEKGILASEVVNKDKLLKRASANVTSLLQDLKDKLEELSTELEGAEDLESSSDIMGLEDSENLDGLIEKGNDEMGESLDFINDLEKEDEEKDEDEEKEGTKEAKDKSKDKPIQCMQTDAKIVGNFSSKPCSFIIVNR